MSRWLQRALADIGTPASVPIAPLAPIGPPAQAIGTIGVTAQAPPWRRIGRLTTMSAPRSASSTASCRNGKPKLSPSTKRLRLSALDQPHCRSAPEAEADDAKLGHALVGL